MRSDFILLILLAATFGCGPKTSTPAPKVTALIAASATNAFGEVSERFEAEHPGSEIQISAGPSNGLAQQILAGAPVDIYLSANEKWSDAIESENLAEQTAPLLGNRLILVVPKGNPAKLKSVGDLTSERVSRVAIAGESVPAGIYAEQALKNLGLFDPLKSQAKLARGAHVRITLTYVELGEAEAGIVYATDALNNDAVEVVCEIDSKHYDPIRYPVVLVKREDASPHAKMFFDYLQSSAAQEIFKRHGFASPDSTSSDSEKE